MATRPTELLDRCPGATSDGGTFSAGFNAADHAE
jgi:hypothetical protein